MKRARRLGHMAALSLVAMLAWMVQPYHAVRAGEQQDSAAAAPQRGICVVLDVDSELGVSTVLELAASTECQIYFQSPSASAVHNVRQAAGPRLLGTRVVAEAGALESLHLASNLVDHLIAAPAAAELAAQGEILRVLRGGGTALVGQTQLVKPRDESVDSWSHVYHGPDNNPQSSDQLARAPYRTQFLAAPLFSPMPEVTVAAGGRIFKAFGHIAHKANQNPVLNTLYCINAFNGTVLWQRPLSKGYMIHRNTMIATEDQFYLADDKSCKLIDPATGEVRSEIVVPDGLADGKVWKWMALENGVLYALVGGEEIHVDTISSQVRGIGHWPWGMWKGHDYGDPRTNFGFGRTFLAIDPHTRKVLWRYHNDDYIDARGVCMRGGRIYCYSPERFLACLDAAQGELAWKNSDPTLLAAIGPNEPAQHYVTGYATTTYIKCNDQQLFFAGPQRQRFVVASTEDGRLLWEKAQGNLQVVLRDDGVYCAGPQRGDDNAGAIYGYDGNRLASLPIRRACTRATGSVDGVFYRTSGGTVRVDTSDQSAEHIAPMRPPCQDGVVISDGLLFWGPWMCGCQLSLYGHIALGPAAGSATASGTPEPQLARFDSQDSAVEPFASSADDWPAYLHDSARSGFTRQAIPPAVQVAWRTEVAEGALPTAPIVAGDTVFVANRHGAVYAVGMDGKRQWEYLTGGPIYYPPTLENGRLFVGSSDGHVYALAAATGRLLWSYRVAPSARRMPVYGNLISTWPVAGGVVVQDGVVYAAAGIAHYDGTYVVALDGATGDVRWANDSSGVLSQDVNCGISLQGELQLRGNELQFLGGGAYLFARYDRQTGACLNEPRHEVTSLFQTAFYPYYPDYAQYAALHHTLPDGSTLMYNPTYDGSRPSPLALLAPASDQPQPAAKRDAKVQPAQRKPIWQTDGPVLLNAHIITPNTLVSGGPGGDGAELVARSLEDGSVQWRQPLPAPPVKSGLAMDSRQRIVVALNNGQLVCFTAAE